METHINSLFKCRNNHDCTAFKIRTIQSLYEYGAFPCDFFSGKNQYQIVWITKGTGKFRLDPVNVPFENDHVFLLKPFQVCSFHPLDELEGYAISFSDSFLGPEHLQYDGTSVFDLFVAFIDNRNFEICSAILPDLKDLADKMLWEYNGTHSFRAEILSGYLKILFIQLSRQCGDKLQRARLTRNVEITHQFISLLDKHFKSEKTVSGYAGMLMVTPNYLNEIVKKSTGYSAGYHIRQRIVLEVKRQLTFSNSGMKEIGYNLGFNDMAHFSKFFKTVTGQNFTDYKKERTVLLPADEDYNRQSCHTPTR